METFAPADVEDVLVAYLAGALGVPVSTQVPAERPELFVTLERLAGRRPNLVQDEATVGVRCWGDLTSSATLAQRTYRLFDALGGQGVPGCYVYWPVKITGPANDPDPKSGTPRYRLTVTLRTRLIVTEETP